MCAHTQIKARVRAFLCGLLPTAAIQIASSSLPAAAQTANTPAASSQSVETVVVTGTTPVPGSGIDIDKLPYNVETLDAADMTRAGSASLTKTLNNQLGSVNINDNLDDPFQPNILFRGFEASPALGTPEGLAVYQNGVRINEAFGDSLNWDLVPAVAIDRVAVVGSNPVYGLNALGGAVVINMKNGFDYDSNQAELSGGSWGQRNASIQYGTNSGAFGFYVAARGLQEDGWREFSPDKVEQFYTDLTYRGQRLSLDLNFTGANNRLDGESPTPVQELAVSRSLIFTSPQSDANKLAFIALNGAYAASQILSIQGAFYYRAYWQNIINGDTTNYTACTVAQYVGFMCQADGATPLHNAAGELLPDISKGGTVYIGEVDFETIHTNSVGGSLQATEMAPLFGHDNQLTTGGSIDSATTDFGSSAELGTINSALVVSSSGLFVDTPEKTPWTATPVNLGAINTYYGIFATDTFNITDALTATASGRYNLAQIDFADHLGHDLSGHKTYDRFNPALGLTDKLTSTLTAYAGYSEGSRDPTPGEIECSNPAAPCVLPSSLSSDPPTLRQVVSHTWEAGLRGRFSASPLGAGLFTWNASVFHTDVDDDIYGVATSLSTGFFKNIGGTRRQGVDLGLRYYDDRISAFLDYSYIAATFQSALLLPSAQNPGANANGDIQVRPGDVLPGIPAHRVKLGADYRVTPCWLIGADITYESGQYFVGDESNQLATLPGFAVVDLHSRYQVTGNVELFVDVENALNASYATYGILGDPTGIGAPGIPPNATTNGPGVNNRFESPAPPISAVGGIRISL